MKVVRWNKAFLTASLCFFFICNDVRPVHDASRIIVYSSAFEEEVLMPRLYSCDGSDISPPIAWDPIPRGTRSFVLICDDPDAPRGTWVHWVLYNIPPEMTKLPARFGSAKNNSVELEGGIGQGLNSWGRIGYGGPCPPKGHGVHRYYFTVYALDTMLTFEDKERVTKEHVLKAMKGHIPKGHIIVSGYAIGRYKR